MSALVSSKRPVETGQQDESCPTIAQIIVPRPLSGTFWGSVYAVAPDGKRILVNQITPDFAALEVIVNWPALLKK